MRLLLLILLSSGITLFSPKPSANATYKTTLMVYVCVSTTAYAYHVDYDCRGLQACTHTIRKVTEDDAINKYGRKACKICSD